jgi:hypothetical protein
MMTIETLKEALSSRPASWAGGTVVGFVGKYCTDKFTGLQQRREKHAEITRRFAKCRDQMPELFEEMKTDVSANPLKFEFLLRDERLTYGKPQNSPLVYFMNADKPNDTYFSDKYKATVHAHLHDKVKILQANGFVTDVTTMNVPYFRMTEEFHDKFAHMKSRKVMAR